MSDEQRSRTILMWTKAILQEEHELNMSPSASGDDSIGFIQITDPPIKIGFGTSTFEVAAGRPPRSRHERRAAAALERRRREP